MGSSDGGDDGCSPGDACIKRWILGVVGHGGRQICETVRVAMRGARVIGQFTSTTTVTTGIFVQHYSDHKTTEFWR